MHHTPKSIYGERKNQLINVGLWSDLEPVYSVQGTVNVIQVVFGAELFACEPHWRQLRH